MTYKREFDFTYQSLEKILLKALELGYNFFLHKDYKCIRKDTKEIYLRIDVDYKIQNLDIILNILKKLDIKASIYFRLHSEHYNLFTFESIRILNKAKIDGHEIGYHSEIVDLEMINNIPAKEGLIKSINVIESFFDLKISGVASHGGLTGYNNLDYWTLNQNKDTSPLYEAYDEKFGLFQNSIYFSDSENFRWKVYRNGERDLEKSSIDPMALLEENNRRLTMLIHPEVYFKNHCYE